MLIIVQAGVSCEWIKDSQHFLLEHFDTIRNSPLHIYCYALPFSPPSSWLHKYYTAELPQGVRVVKGILAEWGTCSRTVFLNKNPFSLAYLKDTIAVSLYSSDITILNAITGNQVAVLSGHTGWVKSVTFSSDGTFLASGSDDKTIKLWDVQTGGVIKTFHGHTGWVVSVSISPDCATIAAGSWDSMIYLWHVQRGDCFYVITGHNHYINSVSFSPTDSQLLISASGDNTVRQWDITGCQIGPTHEGNGVVFSSDGTHFVSWREQVATVRNSDSRVVVAELQVPSGTFQCCCFSPNGKFVVGSAGHTIYIWDITGSDPHLSETLSGHTDEIASLIFPSPLISASKDRTLKFWQIGASSTDPVTADQISTLPTPSPIWSVSLQGRGGVAISSDLTGVVRIWDVFTGHCKASFQTPATGSICRDAQLIESRLIVIWHSSKKIHIWDAEKGDFLQTVGTGRSVARGVRISGDGSTVFCLFGRFIQAWSIQTGEVVGKVGLEDISFLDPHYADGSRIWICFKNSPIQGWNFGIPGSPIQLSNTFLDRSLLNFIDGTRKWSTSPSMIKDAITGRVVFQLVGRYADPAEVQWDGQYLVAGYRSGEVLILDFKHTPSQ